MANEVNVSGARPARRTIVKGAAWAVPAVAVASAAPAFASSPPEIINWDDSSACKIPGNSMGYCYNKGYVLWAEFQNPTNETLTICVTGMEVGGFTQCIVGLADVAVSCNTAIDDCFTIDPLGTRNIAIYSNAADDSGSNNVTVYFTYAQGANPAQNGDTSGEVTGGSWSGDTGQGSCAHGCSDGAPLSACGTNCENLDGASIMESTTETTDTESEPTEAPAEEAPVEETEAPAEETEADAPAENTEADAPAENTEADAPAENTEADAPAENTEADAPAEDTSNN